MGTVLDILWRVLDRYYKHFYDGGVSIVNRTMNDVAHVLAKGATKIVIDRDWVGVTPDRICDIIKTENFSIS